MPVKVLVVDDSVLYRRVLTDALRSLPEVEVVGSAANGANAVAKVRELHPDLVTLDIEMPGMNGIEVMSALRQAGLEVKVLIVSSVTVSGGQLTLQALRLGAFDFITKPSGSRAEDNFRTIREELAPRLRALAHRVEVQNLLRPATVARERSAAVVRAAQRADIPRPAPESVGSTVATLPGFARKPEMVVIGVSTGGPNALATIFASLPGNLGVPVLVVQHMPPIFTQLLAANLSANSALKVREAAHDEEMVANVAYVAPGGRHMGVAPGAGGSRRLRLSDDPPENNCRPAVDYLFRSAAQSVSRPGPGRDPDRDGRRRGPRVAAAQARRLPRRRPGRGELRGVRHAAAAVEAGVVDVVLPLEPDRRPHRDPGPRTAAMNVAITIDELRVWSRYIHAITGISPGRLQGLSRRDPLRRVAARNRQRQPSELLHKVKADSTQTLRRKVVDAITTNETSFFRDTSPFELLQHKVLPELIDRRRKTVGRGRVPIRIWSAACSTGQELYSTAIVLKELLGGFTGYDIRLLGTDISDQAVAAASRGYFSQLEIERGTAGGNSSPSISRVRTGPGRSATRCGRWPRSAR